MDKQSNEIAWDILKKSFDTTVEDEVSKTYEKISKWTNFKNSFIVTRNSIKFNFISNKSSINLSSNNNTKLINIFHHKFFSEPENYSNDCQKLQKLLSKILFFCYRKNFPPIKNTKKQSFYTSDSGWGCMIRCGQMILSRALYKVFKHQHFTTYDSIYKTLVFFQEIPYKLEELPDDFVPIMNYFLKKSYSIDISKEIIIRSFVPPFSIKTICEFGELFDKTAGEWFSDVYLCQIFQMIKDNFNCLNLLNIIYCQSCINIPEIINKCFTNDPKLVKDKSNFMDYKNEKYYFYKMGLLFISVRLGIDKILSEYYTSIKELFSCHECLGFIGGKHSYAYYFIGFDNQNFFYLDPHITKECAYNIKEETDLSTYLIKNIHSIPYKDLQTSFTIGFLIRNLNEYNNLISWMQNYCKSSYPCFGYINSDVDINNDINMDYDINIEEDDF